MRFFHYLFDAHSGVGEIVRVSEYGAQVFLPLPDKSETSYELPINKRDRRVLVVVDGELMWESIPKAGDLIHTSFLGVLATKTSHLRKARFGTPSYYIEENKHAPSAHQALFRLFLLLPAGNAVFRRIRDKRSFGPMYVFVEVTQTPDGPSVIWRNSSY